VGRLFLARCLNVSGVYLGKKLLLSDGSAIDNPKGFWENEDFTKLSKKYILKNNLRWDLITSDLKCSENFKQEIKKIVDKLVSESYLSAGVKDPKLLFLLDSIMSVLPEKKIFVGIFRHPLKVAESLKIRNNFDYEKSLELWQAYNSKLLDYIINNNGFLINFDWPKEKLLNEISLIVKKVGLIEADLNQVYSEDLFRSDKSYISSYKIPTEIENTYQKLKKRSMQNNSINQEPNTFSIDESREIMSKLLDTINEFTEVKKFEYKNMSLLKKIQINKRRLRRRLRKLTN